MTTLEALRELIQRDAIAFGDFTLKSGQKSHYYFDLRKVTLSAMGANLIGASLWELFADAPITAIGGPATAAIPIIGATLAIAAPSGGSHLKGFYVRSEAKAHGTGKRIEGPVGPHDQVLLIEDTVTTGGSLLDAAEALKEAGIAIWGAIWLVDRGMGALETVNNAGIAARALFTLKDFDLEPR
ncbi:MAG: orotate phosphoribosyltransferase [bacterium]